MFLVAITVLIVMAAGAIAVDLSAVATRGQSLQNAADSAALAGVQAYRDSMGERTDANATDEAAALAAINALLEQNGIALTPAISFPDPTNDTEVRVTLFDGDAGFLLSGFTGGAAGTVERSATAQFERCEDGCLKEVAIPPPFSGVNAFGDGDGYKPIPVGDNLYSINHQSGNGRGNHQITCVQRNEELCFGENTPGMLAYPSNNIPYKTPEMPHAAVSGSKIYWASSTASGHYMFCFETETPAPCSNPLRLNSNTQATNLSARLIHRGGGTVEEDGLIYTFTDDHKVHCIVPGDSMYACGGYPKDTGLGAAGFPDNDKSIGNHGSSIDRIVDDSQNKIYSTIHIDNVPGSENACPDDDPNMQTPTGVVVLKNASSGIYIAINDSYNGLVDGVDPEDTRTHWEISSSTSGGTRYYRFQSVAADDDGYNRYIANATSGVGEELELVNGSSSARVWRVLHDGSTSRIRTWYEWSGERQYIREDSPDGNTIEFTAGDYQAVQADWIIRPWQCEAPDPGPDIYDGILYEAGTYLDCFDVGAGAPCAGFTPSKIHNDWDSFSGRLFFNRNGAGDITGVCSTGFTEHWDWYTNMSSYTEISCVSHVTGAEDTSAESSFAPFRNALASHNTATPNPYEGNARWGTWGDPHYNSFTNRIFYPTHRTDSAVLCWDFDTGPCVEGIERVGTTPLGDIQDYGFFSEGNCIYGLGHNAIFWAFRADDIGEECNGSGKTTSISPCDCGGNLFWGTVTFDVTEEQFEEFLIEIEDDDGNRVFPAPSSGPNVIVPAHSLLTDGDTIDLNFIPATDTNQRLWVTVTVIAKDGVDPWADGDGSQTFTIEIGRTPHLTD